MVTLIVNPIVVTLAFVQTELGTDIVVAKDDNDSTIVTITPVHSKDNSKLLMRDHRTNLVYESKPIARISDTNHLFELLELMLNHVNLTHIQRTARSDNSNPSG